MMGDQEDSNKLVCPDCQFTTHKERKLMKHVKKTHEKDPLKCPFCVTNVHYSSDTPGLSSHKRHEHRQVRLNCFLCEFRSKSVKRWTTHLIQGHGKPSRRLADLGNKQRKHSPAFTSVSQKCDTSNNRDDTCTIEMGRTQRKRCIRDSSIRNENNATNAKIQTGIGEMKNKFKKRKISKKRKRLCSEDDSNNVIDLTSDRTNEFSRKKSTDRIKRQRKQFLDNDTVINVSSDECSYNKERNKGDSSKVDKSKTSLKRSKTKSADVLLSSSDVDMICLSSDDGHGERMEEESSKKESEDSNMLDSYLVMVSKKTPKTVSVSKTEPDIQKDSDKKSVCLNKTINNVKKRSSEAEDQFSCPYCTQCFSSSILRTQHFKTQHAGFITSDSKYACKLCSHSGKCIANLIVHIRSHTGERPFECETCHYRCKTKGDIVKHMRVHSNERPYKCYVCSYRSNCKASLDRHIRIHTNTRPYKCSMCDYAAHMKSNLTNHLRTHTGEKPFECHRCHRSFTQRQSLNKHLTARVCY